MNRTEKELAVEQLRTCIDSASSLLVVDLTGMNVDLVNALRSNLRKKGVSCQVAKNTLIRLAIADTEVNAIAPLLAGPTALMWHTEEPSAPAKVVKEFRKELKKADVVTIKGAYIDGDLLEAGQAMTLADIPSKDELRSQLLGLIEAVPGKFLALLQTAPRKFLGVLEAQREKLEEGEEAA